MVVHHAVDFVYEDDNKNVELSESIERMLELENNLGEEMMVEKTQMDFASTVVGNIDVPSVENGQKMDDNNNSTKKVNKKKVKRGKKRKRNQNQLLIKERFKNSGDLEADDAPEIEYVEDLPDVNELEPMYRQFASVFENFRLRKPEEVAELPVSVIPSKNELMKDSDDEGEKQNNQNEAPISNRKRKQRLRPSVAELKRQVSRPDVIEMHDIAAPDPLLLVHLKSTKNTVQVPRHWCSKTKYLQRKRGIEKAPFELPDFLKRTGITELRANQQSSEENKTLKCKMREKARPKMGRIDIEYDKLYDAFFKWQTKPRMTIHGDLYYEGKEFETRMFDKKPGELSDELRHALGMPLGHNAYKQPPPYLIAMQRYGPPPSYSHLKIPGLNAPLPEGCAFGYHIGGWGKPPVDHFGKPLYGDVFGVNQLVGDYVEEIDRKLWGEPESDEEEEDEDEDEDGVEEGVQDKNEEADMSGFETPLAESVAPSDFESMDQDIETPLEAIELRKKKIEKEMEDCEVPSLYTVINERKTEGFGASMMGSTHIYDMTGAGGQVPPSVIAARRAASQSDEPKVSKNSIELALDPSELDLDSETMASKYEQTMRAKNKRKEDMTDLLQEHLKRHKGPNKKNHSQSSETKTVKKYKEFKF